MELIGYYNEEEIKIRTYIFFQKMSSVLVGNWTHDSGIRDQLLNHKTFLVGAFVETNTMYVKFQIEHK